MENNPAVCEYCMDEFQNGLTGDADFDELERHRGQCDKKDAWDDCYALENIKNQKMNAKKKKLAEELAKQNAGDKYHQAIYGQITEDIEMEQQEIARMIQMDNEKKKNQSHNQRMQNRQKRIEINDNLKKQRRADQKRRQDRFYDPSKSGHPKGRGRGKPKKSVHSSIVIPNESQR